MPEALLAESAVAVALWQYSIGVLTVGATGVGLILTVMGTLVLSQLNGDIWLT